MRQAAERRDAELKETDVVGEGLWAESYAVMSRRVKTSAAATSAAPA